MWVGGRERYIECSPPVVQLKTSQEELEIQLWEGREALAKRHEDKLKAARTT